MNVIIRPGLLRHLCKEPLDEVESVRLRGRGIVRLTGLDACPKLVSLNVSRNALTDLGETGIAECRSLWILDVSHNSLETLAGLSLFMALGYLDLSNNPISLKALRSIARSHVLELVLGRDCKPNERRQILRMLPNVWVLDEEFVTEKERRDAESSQQRDKSGGNTKNAHDFLVSNDKTTAGPAEFDAARDSGVKKKHREISARGGNRAPHDMACSYSSHYRILERQSRRTQEFFKNVIWKIPSRADKADSFRLVSLLEYYDKRVVATNKRTWLSTFTHGANILRRDWSVSLPRSHNRVLRSLPVGARLDVAVLLAVRAAFRDNIPQQVLEEALLVLFMPHSQIPAGAHSDLSRIPPFVCTALVHALRSSILEEQAKASHESRLGYDEADARASLDETERELLDALPPVVTGIDNELEIWNSRQRGSCSGNPARENPEVDEQLECANRDGESSSTAREPNYPLATKDAFIRERRLADTSKDNKSVPNAPGTNTDDSQDSAACTPPTSVGLLHLCRRAVILLTRSPTCPNLVERQTGTTNHRLYEQMAPLLARANMSYEDLHTGFQKESPAEFPTGRTNSDGSREACGAHQTASLFSTSLSRPHGRQGLDLAGSEIDSPKTARPSFTQSFPTSTDGSGWRPHIRFPKPGERVQVLHNSWSVIVSTSSSGTSATVAPFAGIQDPPYCGVTNLNARDLCYDPRGWWKHAAAFARKPPPPNGWLYRSSRGLSVDGFHCGASDPKQALGHLEDALRNKDPVEVRAAATSEKCFQDTDDFGIIQQNSAFDHVGNSALSTTSPSTRRFCSSLDVFSAEGAWDPAFVVAPARMIDLHKGFSRTGEWFPWRGIDDPEATVRIRSTMSRCFTSDLATKRDHSPWPPSIVSLRSSPAKRRMRRPYPTPISTTSRHEEGNRVRGGLTRSSSMPSKITGSSVTTEPSATVKCAWIELKREMGSLKADNRMISHREDGANCGKGVIAYSRKARPLLPTMSPETTSTTRGSDDFLNAIAMGSVLSKKFASLREVAAPKTNLSDGGVFELTQAEHRSLKLDDGAAIDFSPGAEVATTRVDDKPEEASTVTTKTPSIDEKDRASTDLNETLKRDRQQGCSWEKDNVKTPAVVAAWKPNANRPLEWFPVSSRHHLLVDAGSIATTMAPALTGITETCPSRNGFSSLTVIRRKGGDDETNDRGRDHRHHECRIKRENTVQTVRVTRNQERSVDGGKNLAGLSTVSSVGLALSPINSSLA